MRRAGGARLDVGGARWPDRGAVTGPAAAALSRPSLASLLVGVCLLAGPAARADTPPGEGEACVQARAMNDAVIGEARSWSGGEAPHAAVSGARARLCAAYQLCPTYAELLHNLDITTALLGDPGGALRYCEDYVRATVEGDARRESATRRCARLRARVEAETVPVRVVVDPAGARVVIDGDLCGALLAPATRRLAPGTHTLDLDADGYLARHERVEVAAGVAAPTAVDIALEPAPTVGAAHITSEPTGAAVSVAGRDVGDTPVEVELPAGDHAVAVTRLGYFTAQEHILVEAGSSAALHVTLVALPAAPPEPIPEGGWGALQWTGVAVTGLAVAAAGAGLGLHLVGAGEAGAAADHIAEGLPHAAYASERDAYDAGAQKVSAALWLYGGAGALAVGGLVMMLLPTDGAAATVGLAPTRGGAMIRAGASWGGTSQ